ncbi:Fic/DOC family protein [Mesorhizobium sophorae]|uniref:Fic/DOC family protein n=1 Tax=Mesorhizobium sophorae TaxID=1300294 RepID=UPI000BA35189|nr:Fic family protein [Mesorhizobium sophorae]
MADPYLVPGSEGLLRNEIGLTTIEELWEAEYHYAEVGAAELFASQRNIQLSMRGWRTVHKVLFRDVYDWAGEYRTVFLIKDNERGRSRFCEPSRIEAEGTRVLDGLKATLRHLDHAPFEKIAEEFAGAYVDLNQVHPFRVGNGRSQKVFFSLIARRYGIQLNWAEISPEEHNKAAVDGSFGELGLICQHFRSIAERRSGNTVTLSYPVRQEND